MVRAVRIAMLAVGLLLGLGLAGARADEAAPAEPLAAPPPGWVEWNDNDYFGPCRGDCSLALLGGREITTGLAKILSKPVAPWDWRWGDSGFVSGVFARRLVTLWGGLDIVPEIGVGKRFGADAKAAEGWAAIGVYWTRFPWDDYLGTKIGFAEGIDIATQIDRAERLRALPGHTGSVVLNYISPEIDFSLPRVPGYELVFRINHRSGIWGLINGVNGGAQYGEAGLRVHF
jgi:hypothetical protein